MQRAADQIPSVVVQKWQEIVNLLAQMVDVPAALVMKVEPPMISVFVRSESHRNPYHPEETACLGTGLYCETVMSMRDVLLVPDALADENWCTNPDVKLGMISYLGLPIAWPDGEIFGTICVLDNKRNEYNALYQDLLRQFREVVQGDLTLLVELETRRRAEEELRQAKEVAEAANRAKDEFIANVSHEIRTPMNAILGMTEIVLGTSLDDGQRRLLGTARSAAENLLGTIADILDFSKIEAGKLALDPSGFSLRAMIDETISALAPRAQQKGLALAPSVRDDVPDAVVGDVGRLRQVLVNLVGNAIKFTERGNVTVDVARANDGCVHFSITDTGIGISPDKQRAIFRAFEQADMSTTRRYGGTGLGLTIAARLVTLMGGELSVDSAPDRGSTFAFAIGLDVWPNVGITIGIDAPAPRAKDASILKILVAEDDDFSAELLQLLLARRGHVVDVARTGPEAVRLADAESYDVLLLDVHLPELDGFGVIGAIRARERATGKRLPVVAVTARSRDQDRIRCLDAGMDDFLVKPVSPTLLLAVIDRVAGRV